jgi:phosphatidylglycerophosphate synthase
MLDRFATALLRPAVEGLARFTARTGITANAITVAGFVLGMLTAVLIATQNHFQALAVMGVSRLCDALDGAVARLHTPSDAGGFLDIALDFLFYASIPLGFAVSAPQANALAAATLLAAFVGTASSFLAFATLAAKRGMHNTAYPDKSIYFLGGLTEGTETLAFFAVMCVWPQHFAALAYTFAALCAVTIATRIWWGWRCFA